MNWIDRPISNERAQASPISSTSWATTRLRVRISAYQVLLTMHGPTWALRPPTPASLSNEAAPALLRVSRLAQLGGSCQSGAPVVN